MASPWRTRAPHDHLLQADLAERWRISARTLERLRWQRIGPPYLKVGGRVVYRLEDVLAYEADHLRGGG
ncbi:helix-turn-helix domain-containing protein [Falsiroseomonas sp. HW251]|uniref:helix-turn-helix domain-containing protein n=1 Tax=Falsiroseomonas sp. HW251 TaxID=3390998 RepID=UPI003D3159B3